MELQTYCQNCEHRILSECPGLDADYTGIQPACFLDNIYGLASDSPELSLMSSSYTARSDIPNMTKEQFREMLLSDVLGYDVYLHKTKSPLYKFWNIRRAIAVIHQLEIYQMLNVNMTLKDYCGESFYVGIPKLTALFVRKVKNWLKSRKNK